MKTACDDCGELFEPDELRLVDGLRICEECVHADHEADCEWLDRFYEDEIRD